jgi:hypothetical protein
MNDDRETLEALLGGLVPLEPPRELEGRVLLEAKAALARRPHRDAWSRIWESRPLRLAWAAAVLGLLAANAVLPAAKRDTSATVVTPHETDDLHAIARLPRIDLTTLPGGEGVSSPRAEKPSHAKTKTKEGAS